MRVSASFLVSASSLACLSASAYCSASVTMRSFSESLSFVDAVMVMLICLPVPRSFAVTSSTPSALISKVTSICGTPRGAGGIPSKLKLPRLMLSLAMVRSP